MMECAAAASEVMQPAGHAGSCHSALVIDEVLENILLWMGQCKRMKVAALVCQQWRTAANQVCAVCCCEGCRVRSCADI